MGTYSWVCRSFLRARRNDNPTKEIVKPVRPSGPAMGDNTKEQINMTKVEELEAEIKEVEDNEKEIERQIRDIDEEMENL